MVRVQMKIDKQDVEKVALLSRLEFSESELETFTGQLNAMLDYAEMMENLDVADVKPTAHVLPLQNVLRKDEVRPSLDHDLALSNAPEAEDGYFKVPKIVEG